MVPHRISVFLLQVDLHPVTVIDNGMGFMFGLPVSGITLPCVKRTEATGYNWAVHSRVENKRTR